MELEICMDEDEPDRGDSIEDLRGDELNRWQGYSPAPHVQMWKQAITLLLCTGRLLRCKTFQYRTQGYKNLENGQDCPQLNGR